MSLFSFYVLPYSYKTENTILPRNGWSLYKVFWHTESKSPSIFEEHAIPENTWQTSTLLYNKALKSTDDPFGWNKATGLVQNTQNLLRRALDVSSKTSEPL